MIGGKSKVVWSGRPSVSVFYLLYGIIAVAVLAVLVGLQLWVAGHSGIGKVIFPKSLAMGGLRVPYPVELATVVLIVIVYVGSIVKLALLRVRNKYELREDGLYVDHGILSLQNTYVAPMAFSDARLELPVSLRLLRRGNIIVDTNDNRHFKLLLIENPLNVQSLIRRTLGHPVVRIESPSPP
jgi:hypothetical protein